MDEPGSAADGVKQDPGWPGVAPGSLLCHDSVERSTVVSIL